MSTPDETSVERLAQQAFGPETRVDELREIAGDASTRRYLRARLVGDAAPETAVVMILADRAVAMSSDELAVFDAPPQELPYLNVDRFLKHVGVATPAIHAVARDESLLLLEDIGDTPLWDVAVDADEAAVEGWYKRAIDTLVRFQVDGTANRDDRCIAFQQAFDKRLFEWEFEHFIEWGIEEPGQVRLDPTDAARMREQFAAIADELDAAPRCLNHRDFHSWNLYVHEGEIRVIDFQDALLAPIPYDLATLLGDRTTTEIITEAIETRLLAYFRDRWESAAGASLDRVSFERTYYLCALQKALKVVGRFYYLELFKKKVGYLRFLPPTVRQIRRVIPKLGLEALENVLDPYLPAGAA